MTAKEFLAKEALRFGHYPVDAFDGDVDLRPGYEVSTGKVTTSAEDLIQLAHNLQEAGYSLTFMRDTSIHVHAPHRKEHSWDDRGWGCTHGLTVQGCEKFRGPAWEKVVAKARKE